MKQINTNECDNKCISNRLINDQLMAGHFLKYCLQRKLPRRLDPSMTKTLTLSFWINKRKSNLVIIISSNVLASNGASGKFHGPNPLPCYIILSVGPRHILHWAILCICSQLLFYPPWCQCVEICYEVPPPPPPPPPFKMISMH